MRSEPAAPTTIPDYIDCSTLPSGVREALSVFRDLLEHPPKVRSPDDLEQAEVAARAVADLVFQETMTVILQKAVASPEVRDLAVQFVRNLPIRMRSDGLETVQIRTSRGTEVPVETPYYLPKGRRGRRKRHGLYPVLVLLGIEDRCTPTLASTVSRSVAMLGSLAEAQANLEQEGVKLDVKTVRTIAYRYGSRARAAQQAGRLPLGPTVQGRRVVISLDGGRIRTRHNKRGPRTPKNRSRLHTPWREPKLLIVYVVGDDGRPSQNWAPIIDGTLRGPDAVVALLQSYARQIDLSSADKVLFVADGAPWIWTRFSALIVALGLRPDQVFTLIDFYHAVQHLVAAVKLRCWSATRRKRWLSKNRHLLRRGGIDKVIAALKAVCKGRNARKVKTHLMYFVDNRQHFDYALMDELTLPKGSGAMESAIRRVVNLRIQGASIYWLEKNVEAILILRSFYKSNRWHCLRPTPASTKAPTL